MHDDDYSPTSDDWAQADWEWKSEVAAAIERAEQGMATKDDYSLIRFAAGVETIYTPARSMPVNDQLPF